MTTDPFSFIAAKAPPVLKISTTPELKDELTLLLLPPWYSLPHVNTELSPRITAKALLVLWNELITVFEGNVNGSNPWFSLAPQLTTAPSSFSAAKVSPLVKISITPELIASLTIETYWSKLNVEPQVTTEPSSFNTAKSESVLNILTTPKEIWFKISSDGLPDQVGFPQTVTDPFCKSAIPAPALNFKSITPDPGASNPLKLPPYWGSPQTRIDPSSNKAA